MTDNPVETAFNRLGSEVCWGIHYSPQLNLSMSFGEPSLRIRDPYQTDSKLPAVQATAQRRNVVVQGAWWLWLYGCYWRIDCDGALLAASSSSFRDKRLAFLQLEGQRIVSALIDSTTGRTTFVFDLGCSLRCRRLGPTSSLEVWMLYQPDGNVLCLLPDGSSTLKPASD